MKNAKCITALSYGFLVLIGLIDSARQKRTEKDGGREPEKTFPDRQLVAGRLLPAASIALLASHRPAVHNRNVPG
jgi:hypothetical protein